jgi:hypothetical protein
MKLAVNILLGLLLATPVFSQEKDEAAIRILLHGLVMDSKSLAPLAGSQLLVNRRFSAVTDENGAFALYINIYDTLVVSRLGYKPAQMVVSDTLLGKPYVAGIFLRSDTIEIAEVVIIPRVLNLKSEILNPKITTSPQTENARYNVAVSAYTGRTTTGRLGDPATNYGVIREKQKIDAFEKGGIPSDKIAGLSPFMLIPALNLLLNGLPDRPPAYKPDISDYELDQIRKTFMRIPVSKRDSVR